MTVTETETYVSTKVSTIVSTVTVTAAVTTTTTSTARAAPPTTVVSSIGTTTGVGSASSSGGSSSGTVTGKSTIASTGIGSSISTSIGTSISASISASSGTSISTDVSTGTIIFVTTRPPPPPPPSTTLRGPPASPDPEWPSSRRTTGPITTLLTAAAAAAVQARSEPKTSLACLENLEPDPYDITSACSCFSSSYSIEPVTATVTAYPGPTCPGGQPTFPNCFADFHPYNCGTDKSGIVACSCALTTEETAECTLGDYERDNACQTSDDCRPGWFCTLIDCFDDDIYSVCTKACPARFDNAAWAAAGRFLAQSPAARDLGVVVDGRLLP